MLGRGPACRQLRVRPARAALLGLVSSAPDDEQAPTLRAAVSSVPVRPPAQSKAATLGRTRTCMLLVHTDHVGVSVPAIAVRRSLSTRTGLVADSDEVAGLRSMGKC
jgi:hypothetical protein